jgi:hypothetical protein
MTARLELSNRGRRMSAFATIQSGEEPAGPPEMWRVRWRL